MNNYMEIKWITWKNGQIFRKVQSFLNQKEIEIMNKLITSIEIEAVIKNLPQKQNPRSTWLHRRILSNTQRRANAYPSKTLSKKNCRGKNTSKHILQVQHHSDTKPDKDNTKKQNYKAISLMNIAEKVLNKFQPTKFSHTSKSSYTTIKLGLFQECKCSSKYTNPSK